MTLEHLKRLAEAATRGPWVPADRCVWTAGVGSRFVASTQSDANAAFISAANPAKVLELVAELERLRAEVHTLSCWAEAAGSDGRNPLVKP